MKSSTLRQNPYEHYASLSQVVKQDQPDLYQPQIQAEPDSRDLAQELNESNRLHRIQRLNQSYLQGLNQLHPRPNPSPSTAPKSHMIEQEMETTPPKSFQASALSTQRAKKQHCIKPS